MFCSGSNSDEVGVFLRRQVFVAVVVSVAPLVAFLYSLIVWATYSVFREIRWMRPKSLWALFLRAAVVAAACVAGCGAVAFCESCGEIVAIDNNNNNNSTDTSKGCLVGTVLAVTLLFLGLGFQLMMQTRREEVVGVSASEIPFYGPLCLQNKFMVVTGANNGIGFETTRQLAEQGATVAMLCRNPARAKKAMDDIRELQSHLHIEDPIRHPAAGIARGQLHFVPLDLTDFESIRNASDVIKQHLEVRSARASSRKPSYVDALVCNAGLMMGTQATTKDGLETMMQANHLGHFLLMKLMLDQGMLKTTGIDGDGDDGSEKSPPDEPSRVCILTSSTYHFAASTSGFDFVDPYCSNGHREYSLFGQYSMTKLANLLTSRELARRFNTGPSNSSSTTQAKSLAVFAVHPGVVRTNVTSNSNWFLRHANHAFAWILMGISKTPEEGAYSTVYTVAAPLEKLPFWNKGSYVVNCKEEATNDYVEGPSGSRDATRVWEWSERQLSEGEDVRGKSEDEDNDDCEKKEQ